jgi:hypothetical protein
MFGIQIAALGEAIAMSLGEWQIMQSIGLCRRVQLRYSADWERLDEINQAQGKSTRKRPYIPELKGSVFTLFAFMVALEAIGISSQVPHFVAQIRGQSIVETLPGVWIWGYVSLLIVAPGILQAALALGQQYAVISREYVKEDEKELGFFTSLVKIVKNRILSVETSEEPLRISEELPKKRMGKPKVSWWREVYSQLDGERSTMTPGRVEKFVKEEWSETPHFRTLENWAEECRRSIQEEQYA